MEQNLKDKVAKLLRLADPENGATEAEAISAAQKAQKLCLEYGIEMASISLDENNDAVFVENEFLSIDHSGRWRRTLANQIIKNMGGECVWISSYGSHGGKLHVFAPSGTYSSIVSTFRSLENWIDVESVNATTFREETWVHGKTYRNSWILGAVNRISARLREQAERSKDEAKDSGHGMALVRINEDVEAALNAEHPDIVTTKIKNRINASAYSAGQKAGSKADIGSTKIGSQKQLK